MKLSHGRGLILARNILAALALLLALLLAVQSMRHRGQQEEVNTNMTAIQKGQAFANVNNQLIQLIVRQAVEKNDPQLKQLLADNGISYKQQAPAAPAAQAAPPSGEESTEAP